MTGLAWIYFIIEILLVLFAIKTVYKTKKLRPTEEINPKTSEETIEAF